MADSAHTVQDSQLRAQRLNEKREAAAPTQPFEEELKRWIEENIPGLPDIPQERLPEPPDDGKPVQLTDEWKKSQTWYIPSENRDHTGKAHTSSYSWPKGKRHTTERYLRMAKEFASAIHDLTFFQQWALKEAEIHEERERRHRNQYIARLREVMAIRMKALCEKWYSLQGVLNEIAIWANQKQRSEELTLERWTETLTQLVHLQQAYARERAQGQFADDGSAALLERASAYVEQLQQLIQRKDAQGKDLAERDHTAGTEIATLINLILRIY